MLVKSAVIGWLLSAYCVSGAAVGTTTEVSHRVPVPGPSYIVVDPRQVTRSQIVRRAEAKRARAALQPRQSARVYPACEQVEGLDPIPETGFAELRGWNIERESANYAYTISGYAAPSMSRITCVMLCQENSECTGMFWDESNKHCQMRKGTPSGTAISAIRESLTLGLEGTCAGLESQINNATIMASCCDNKRSAPTPCGSTSYHGFENWGVSPRVDMTSQNRLTNGGSLAAGSYKACLAACESYTARSFPIGGQGCTSAWFDGYKATDGTNDCFLYGGAPKSNVLDPNNIMVTFIKGGCNQARANGIDVYHCCDSVA